EIYNLSLHDALPITYVGIAIYLIAMGFICARLIAGIITIKFGEGDNMAKLEGVKVVDMKDGEVTKIEYEGEEYARVKSEAAKGDIVKVITDGWGDLEKGNYYKSLGTRVGFDTRYTDIEYKTKASGEVEDFDV